MFACLQRTNLSCFNYELKEIDDLGDLHARVTLHEEDEIGLELIVLEGDEEDEGVELRWALVGRFLID